jgi:hypothetical protein
MSIQRAEFLPFVLLFFKSFEPIQLFGASAKYHIDYIMAPKFNGEKYRRSYDTVLPLANHLGIKIDKHW